METLLTHVAGVDVHREVLVITVLIGEADEKPKAHYLECRTYTDDLKRCGEQLLGLGVKHVAMESTGVYWKPAYAVWQAMGLSVTVGNAYHLRNVPGRKTDKKDSEWLAELHRNGLIRASYVPDEEFQALRALVRHRTSLVGQISRIKNQAQKVLEDGNVKLGVVLSNVFGVSGLAVLRAIAEGVVDADRLQEKITTTIKRKEEIHKALTNCLRPYHCFLVKQLLLQYDDLKKRVADMETEIERRMSAHSTLIAKLVEIPGIEKTLAQGIIAEATTAMEHFADGKRFAAWAGVAPGNRESAGKKKELEPAKGIPL